MAPPPPAPSPRTKPVSKVLIIVVVVVVAAAAILGGLFALGAFNSGAKSNSSGNGGGGGGGGGSGQTFAQAASSASGSIGSVSGGPWTLIGGAGTVISTSIAVNQTVLNSSASEGGCQAHLLSSASSVTSIPSTSASASSGLSNAWVVWYSNATLGILEVAVFGGTATPILTMITYGGCESSVATVTLPSGYVDSPAAAATVSSNGGSTWVASWPDYDIEEILVPGTSISFGGVVSQIPSTWEITYTTCNLGADDGSTLNGEAPSQFTGSVYSSNGTFERGYASSTACTSAGHGGGGGGGGKTKPNLSTCDGFFFEENNSGVDFYNNGTALCTSITNLTAGGVTVSFENNTTHATVATTGFSLEIVNLTSSAVLSTYNFGTNKWSSGTVPIFGLTDDLNDFVLVTPKSMAGTNIVFTATATAWATGSLTVYLGNEG